MRRYKYEGYNKISRGREVIRIKVIPNSKKTRIFKEGECLKIYVNAPAVRGKANKEMINLLSEFFKIKRGDIQIVSGEKSREKIIEISSISPKQ